MPKNKTTKNKKKTDAKAKTRKLSQEKSGQGKLEAPVYDLEGRKKSKVKLPPEIFDLKASDKLLAQYVRVYLANRRRGTRSTKKRGEVRGSTRKIYRQKGTGRARHGDIRAPIFVGGGVVHGPKPADFSLKLNKKMRRKALFSALSQRFKEGNIVFVEGLTKIKPKTKEAVTLLKKLKLDKEKNLLVYIKDKSNDLILAFRNLRNLSYIEARSINAFAVLSSAKIIFSKEALGLFLKSKEAVLSLPNRRAEKNEN